MPRLAELLAGLCCLPALATVTSAAAQAPHEHAVDDGVAAPVAGREPDSDAPPGSPPHRLPNDTWVHLHWIPFDEARLQSLLHTRRAGLVSDRPGALQPANRLCNLAPPAW